MKNKPDWKPRRWNEKLENCLWLPRMIDKGRRHIEAQRDAHVSMHGYLFGDLDYGDWQLLRFLRTNQDQVSRLLEELDSDQDVAKRIVKDSNRSKEDIEKWNKRFRAVNCLFTPMWDADEAHRSPGLTTTLIKYSYIFILMPPVYLVYYICSLFRRRKK